MIVCTNLEHELRMSLDPEFAFSETQRAPAKPWQRGYLWQRKNAIVLKGRQIGASTSGSVLGIRYAKRVPNSLVAIVSPGQKLSGEVKNRARIGLENIDELLATENATTLGLRNGSRIMSLPGTPKSVRGWTADLLIIDEAAFLDPDTFLAARATVATGGRIIIQSTPAGPYGPFYDMYMDAIPWDEPAAQEPDVKWVRYHISSEQAGTHAPGFLEGEKASMTEEDYNQEYEGLFGTPGTGLVDPSKIDGVLEDDNPWQELKEMLS